MWVGLDLEKNAKLWVVVDGYEELMEPEKVLSRLAAGISQKQWASWGSRRYWEEHGQAIMLPDRSHVDYQPHPDALYRAFRSICGYPHP